MPALLVWQCLISLKSLLAPGGLLRSLLNSWIMCDPGAYHTRVAENYLSIVLYFVLFFLCSIVL